MDVPLPLGRLVQFEWRVRQLYLALSDRQDLSDELRFFCRCMAEDERKDIAVLERSASLLKTMDDPPYVAEEMLAEVEESVTAAEATSLQASLTSDDVLRLALQLEGSTLKQLDRIWVQSFGATIGSLLQTIAPEEEVRIRRLIEAIHTLSSDPSLREEVAALWAAH